ncbi:MAG TPA: hypothetical protein IAC21_05895 [Candidatus Enterenecus merdae]|nr:hypothetical protein [Candidatus Enterenecus merdae]
MPGFDSLRNDPQASRLLGDSAKLEQLKTAPETQKLFDMLRQGTGGDLEQAAGKAAKGDTGQLMGAIRRLMADPEGAQLIQKMKEKLK